MAYNIPHYSINDDDRITNTNRPLLHINQEVHKLHANKHQKTLDKLDKRLEKHFNRYETHYSRYGVPISLGAISHVISDNDLKHSTFDGFDMELENKLEGIVKPLISKNIDDMSGEGLMDNLGDIKENVSERYNKIKEKVKTHFKTHGDTYKKYAIPTALALATALGTAYALTKQPREEIGDNWVLEGDEEMDEIGQSLARRNTLREINKIRIDRERNEAKLELQEYRDNNPSRLERLRSRLQNKQPLETQETQNLSVAKARSRGQTNFNINPEIRTMDDLIPTRTNRTIQDANIEILDNLTNERENAIQNREQELLRNRNERERGALSPSTIRDINVFGNEETARQVRDNSISQKWMDSNGNLTPYGRLIEENKLIGETKLLNKWKPNFMRSKDELRAIKNRKERESGKEFFTFRDNQNKFIRGRRTNEGFLWSDVDGIELNTPDEEDVVIGEQPTREYISPMEKTILKDYGEDGLKAFQTNTLSAFLGDEMNLKKPTPYSSMFDGMIDGETMLKIGEPKRSGMIDGTTMKPITKPLLKLFEDIDNEEDFTEDIRKIDENTSGMRELLDAEERERLFRLYRTKPLTKETQLARQLEDTTLSGSVDLMDALRDEGLIDSRSDFEIEARRENAIRILQQKGLVNESENGFILGLPELMNSEAVERRRLISLLDQEAPIPSAQLTQIELDSLIEDGGSVVVGGRRQDQITTELRNRNEFLNRRASGGHSSLPADSYRRPLLDSISYEERQVQDEERTFNALNQTINTLQNKHRDTLDNEERRSLLKEAIQKIEDRDDYKTLTERDNFLGELGGRSNRFSRRANTSNLNLGDAGLITSVDGDRRVITRVKSELESGRRSKIASQNEGRDIKLGKQTIYKPQERVVESNLDTIMGAKGGSGGKFVIPKPSPLGSLPPITEEPPQTQGYFSFLKSGKGSKKGSKK